MVTIGSCLIRQIISFIRLPNEYGCYAWIMLGNIATLLFTISTKKIIFSDEAHICKQNCHIWGAENPQANIEKSTHPKRVTVWYGFWSRGITGKIFFENESIMPIAIGPCWTNYCSQKLKRKILATFGFNRTALRPTQPKLHSMFYTLFWKIALSAAELMLFGHLRAAIWHRWTIICGVPSKISITPRT